MQSKLNLVPQADTEHFTFVTPRGDMGCVKGRRVTVRVILGHREANTSTTWTHVFATHASAMHVASQLFDMEILVTMLQPDLHDGGSD